MTRGEVIALLQGQNPGARGDELAMYADCYLDYEAAAAHIATYGAITLHPRTWVPIENPYLKVKTQAMAGLLKLRRIKHTVVLYDAV